MRLCKQAGVSGHPARFPEKLPTFFIEFLTEPDDLVIDIFAGSNTTGHAAETLGRKWMTFELSREYLAASVFRFLEPGDLSSAAAAYERLTTEVADTYEVRRQPTLI